MDQDIERRVNRVIAKVMGDAAPVASSQGGALLGEAGGFDSTKTLELIVEIEREFSIIVDDDEIVPENLGTADNLVRFIASKKA